MAQPVYCKSSRSKVKVTDLRNVSAVKHYKMATERLSDFKLGIGDGIEAERDCSASGCLKLQFIAIGIFSTLTF